MVTIYYNSRVMTQHIPPSLGAAEEPARIVGIEARLKGQPVLPTVDAWRSNNLAPIPVIAGSLWEACEIVEVKEAITDADVAAEYGEKAVRYAHINTPTRKQSIYDPACGDIYWSKGSWVSAKTAAAAAILATEAAIRNSNTTSQYASAQHAFCIVRPPGHHCFDVPAGFCILNNVVLAARAALRAGNRVAIVDWDYHFGDGTAAALWGEEDVMFTSLHAARTQSGFSTYPRNTRRDFKGTGLRRATRGRCFNIQWETDDANDAALAYAFQHAILPALARFAPDVILVSAGYDAIAGDDLAGMNLTPAAFGYAAAALTRLGVPVVAVLEGGYNVELLAEGVAHTVRGLRQDPAIMADLEAWLTGQHTQPHHVAVVDEVAAAVVAAPSEDDKD